MVKALVPLNRQEDLADYQKAGAGEYYLGFWDAEWHEKFGEYADINRLTGYKKATNYNTFQEILPIIKRVKAEQASIYVTFNSSIYSQDQLDYMEKYMQPLLEAGVDGIIVSCPELVEIARRNNINAVISTIAGVYNSDIVKYYKQLGVKRVILPRDLSVDDIEKIVITVPDMEYEVFLMRNGCVFSDSNCLGLHRSEKRAICATINNSESNLVNVSTESHINDETELNHFLYHKVFHSNACGLCSIFRFVKMGICAGKIVGRSDESEYVCEDIRLICHNIKIAEKCTSEKEYLENMEFPSNRTTRCEYGMNCYYPETRF